MPRPRLPKTQKLSCITFTKLLPTERKALNRHHRARSRTKHPRASRSAILREAFLAWLANQDHFAKADPPS